MIDKKQKRAQLYKNLQVLNELLRTIAAYEHEGYISKKLHDTIGKYVAKECDRIAKEYRQYGGR